MVDVSPWIWIGLVLLGGAAIGAFVVELIRRYWNAGDAHVGELLDLVNVVVETVKREALEKMRDIPLDEVSAAARSVYRKYVVGTALEKLMNEEAFVGVVVAKWQVVIGIEQATIEAMQLQRVVAGS